LLTALLIMASVGLVVGAIRFRLLPVKILCGGLSIMVAMVGGIAAVNFYYGYYTTWGALWADFHGGAGNLGVVAPTTNTSSVVSGRIGWTNLPGKLSGYSRKGLLYLPPQYGQSQYAHVQFPVVELFHGTPGTPLSWETVLHIEQVANALIAKHQIGPMVLVMPAINGHGHQYEDCLNGPGLNDDTYLTEDVRADLFLHYRVSHDPYQWGVAGYSSGGFCSANLALRHRGDFGAAAIMNGYFRAADGPAATALNNNQSLEAANSPLYEAEGLAANTTPMPAFWVAAGANDTTDFKPASMFATALDRMESVPFIKLNAADTANAWSAALPSAFTWLWQQLASPDLRAMFPVHITGGNSSTLYVPPIKKGPRLNDCKITSLHCAQLPRVKPSQKATQPGSQLS